MIRPPIRSHARCICCKAKGGMLCAIAHARSTEAESETPRISFAALVEGLRFVWSTPIIVQTMVLDFVATFFASANQLLPIFAKDILQVGARGLGFLAASPAIGAVIAGLIMARFGTFRRQGATVIGLDKIRNDCPDFSALSCLQARPSHGTPQRSEKGRRTRCVLSSHALVISSISQQSLSPPSKSIRIPHPATLRRSRTCWTF